MRSLYLAKGGFYQSPVGSNYAQTSAPSLRKESKMPKFTILSRVDAYVDYTCEVEADSAKEAVDLVYGYQIDVKWEPAGTVEFDAVRMSAIDENGDDIDGYTRGKG